VLPDTDPATLARLLNKCIGRPFSEDKLRALTARRFRMASRRALSGVNTGVIGQAVQWLHGEVQEEGMRHDLTQRGTLEDTGMPNSIRVAVASDSDERLDGHFGSCARFLIYQVSADEIRLLDRRSTAGGAQRSDEKNANRTALISDCHLLYVVAIGGPAAAKVVRAGIHPLKNPQGGDAREALTRLQEVLRDMPPPWLSKAMRTSKVAARSRSQ
jgi:nitrogen fixation protein NifX